MDIIIIGAGPSGLMCAIESAKNNNVIIIDQNEKAGKKLYITGKGRCNVTNNVFPDEFLKSVITNPKFLYSSIYTFTPQDTIDFFENQNIHLKTERGNRVFPVSDKASDITKGLVNKCINNGVNFIYNEKVIDINKSNEKFIIKTNKNIYYCDAVVMCGGGKSYPTTGSDGSLYHLIQNIGHKIISPKPALCPIVLKDKWIKDVEGISLKNVSLIASNQNNKILHNLFGEMLFTRNGISGPISLSMSSLINKEETIKLEIDFKPALSVEQLEARIDRECNYNINSQIITILRSLLPKNIVPIFLEKLNMSIDKKVKTLNEKDKKNIVNILKHFSLSFDKIDKIDYAIVTSGGVDTKEINPKTMESKIVKNLYFCGEIIDIDALTGGFNIQIAFSTGYMAGKSLSKGE